MPTALKSLRRTKLQREADSFDSDLYRLIDAAERNAKEFRTSNGAWADIANQLRAARPGVRFFMHSDDREQTA